MKKREICIKFTEVIDEWTEERELETDMGDGICLAHRLYDVLMEDHDGVEVSPLPSVNWRDGKPYNYCSECGGEEPPYEGGTTVPGEDIACVVIGETDEQIAVRMIERWVEYMNENEPDPSGKHRVPPKLKDWLDKEERE